MIANVWCPWCRDHQRNELTADRDAHRARADAAELAADALRRELADARAECARLSDALDAAENRVENLEIARTIGPRFVEVARALDRTNTDALRAVVTAVRHEHAIRAAWLATLPACASAPADVVAAETATAAALAGVPVDVVIVVDALRAECARLRAIVEGRTVPPTDAEIDLHDGAWLIASRSSNADRPTLRIGWLWMVDMDGTGRGKMPAEMIRCWPLSDDGRPCAWPVTP